MRVPRVERLHVLLAVLFVIALVTTTLAARTASPRTASVYDLGTGGASILRDYLRSMGATTTEIRSQTFAPTVAHTPVLFLLGATRPVQPPEVTALRRFVATGGRLVVATDAGINEALLLDAFGVALAGLRPAGEVAVQHVALARPLVRTVSFDRSVLLRAPAAIPLDDGGGVIASVVHEQGELIVVGSLGPFLNATIGDADNGRLAASLALAGGAATVGFDEFHHGYIDSADRLALLTGTWPGRALGLGLLVGFVFLILSGRRLGPPLPLDPRPARSSVDFIRSFAGLIRRSGRREIVRERLRADLRAGLAKREPLGPALAAEARALDARLAASLRDADLLQSVADVDRLAGRPPREGS